MAREASIDESLISTQSPATIPATPAWATPTERSSPRLMPVQEDAVSPVEDSEGGTFRVVSLNLGGRNTNPVEFELKGDNSEMAVEAMAILRNAGKAMKSAKEGPIMMPPSEIEVVQEILHEIFEDSVDEVPSEWQGRIQSLLRFETWAQVLSSIRLTSPQLFNAFNLSTLKLNRPSVWENPDSCKDFTNTQQYLLAWKQWYRSLDRAGPFWLEDAPRVANKRGLDVPTAFAGLLIFDVMCLCIARLSLPSSGKDDDFDGIGEDARDVPFKEIARFAARLPASSLAARHSVAQRIAQGAHALLAQEARSFADHPAVAEDFLPPFCALDGFTAIFLRKASFREARDITAAVANKMEEFLDAKACQELQRAWRTTVSRLAAVLCECHPRLGGFRVCLVSLHVSKSDYTGDFVEKLRDVLTDYDADINVIGMDSNCAAKEVATFHKRLVEAGFDIGCTPKQQQVTVAKQRTAFQTQIQKVGEVDISHKDYILTWTSPRVRRGQTSYTPDLRTPYGVEQETKQCVRLPTTEWPFDHCGVATSFQQRFTVKNAERCKQHFCRACVVSMLIFLLLLSPLVSPDRASPYGQPGLWFHDQFLRTPRPGICETKAPCPDQWLQDGGSCYTTTPRMPYLDVEQFCQEFGGAPVTIESEAENQLMLQSLCPADDFCYIGLLGDFTGRSYWSSGAPLNYTQLVPTSTSVIPIWENSRSAEFLVTLLSNMPGEATGCDVRYTFTFQGGSASVVDIGREHAAPFLALACSGLLLSQERPKHQRLASFLLLMAFCTNFVWASHKMFNACFANDFHVHLAVTIFGRYLMSGGVSAGSTLGLWMIVRRVSVLYPSGVFKQLFWAIVGVAGVFYSLTSLFVDWTSPMALTWAVLLTILLSFCLSAIYVVMACLTSRHLYRTWRCLLDEATSGWSAQGKSLAAQVRAAKLHLVAVTLAVLTGALRWAGLILVTVAFMHTGFSMETIQNIFAISNLVDAVTNDFCAHVLAVLDMDEAVVRAKGVTTEIAERAEREVEQHRLAVRMLKAAPTSVEQLHQLAVLEGKALAAIGSEQEVSAFLILQSAVRVETARIHKLMQCVRMRAMTMRIRYQFLTEVPALEGTPRQHVPEEFATGEKSEAEADKYFEWLYSEASGAQQVLFQQVQDLLAKFNRAVWPSDLGLAPEEFPWRIWAGSKDNNVGMKGLQKDDVISPGDTLIHSPPRSSCLSRDLSALCVAMEEVPPDQALIHRSGAEAPEQVPRDDLRTCNGSGAVFIPGPQKKRQRSLDKIALEYRDSAAWPPAASLVDICRCMILCDDPYAMAVLVAYLRRSAEVLRVKNRFGEDAVEPRASEELQSMFYAASASDHGMSDSQTTTSVTNRDSDRQYRDVSMNCLIRTPSGVPFVCEVQVTLANLAILKHADTKLYTIRRMKSPAELCGARTFAEDGNKLGDIRSGEKA